MKFCHEILELSFSENLKSLTEVSTGFETIPGRDGRIDRQTELP